MMIVGMLRNGLGDRTGDQQVLCSTPSRCAAVYDNCLPVIWPIINDISKNTLN